MKKLKLLLFLPLIFLSSCSTARKPVEEEKKEMIEITDMKDLEDGMFYILHDGKYYPLYEGQSSFPKNEISTYVSDTRSLFFNEDWEYIPTMYMGDSLIYYTNDNLNETVTFERYEDFGYSVGLSNLKRLDSGRYAFDATVTDTDHNEYMNRNSDSYRLSSLSMEQVIIDNIGGAQLRSGNISRGGCIIGLEKDRLYSTDVYVGSNLKNYILKADTRILTAMDVTVVNNYAFLRSKILEIYLPSSFNSGYYRVNDKGIFRYVVGTTYSETTDFNVPNIPVDTTDDMENPELALDDTADTEDSETFTINQETDVKVSFTYQDSENVEYDIEDPVVKLIGPEMSYTLSEYDNNTLLVDTHLMPGQYRLEISGLHGRAYDYKVTKE